MGRAPCCEKVGIKKGRWTAEEDQILSDYIQTNGEGSWRSLPKNAGLKRCGKSCRLRWINYLRSDLKRGNITPEEEELVVKMHSTLGNRWSLIASHLPGRTDNEIKNYWNSHLSRKLHNFIRRPSSVITQDVATVITNTPPATQRLQVKRRRGRTSRSAMKPKTHNTKTRKTKKTTQPEPKGDVEIKPVEGEEALMVELSRPCGYYGTCYDGGDCCNNNNNLMNINDNDSGVLSFDDDIIDLLLHDSDPGHVFTSCGGDAIVNCLGDSEVARGFSETFNQEKSLDCLLQSYEHQVTDEFIDWDCVCRDSNSTNLWAEKESSDSMVSWLLDGDDEATIGKSNYGNFGEPLDHDEENALVAWLLS